MSLIRSTELSATPYASSEMLGSKKHQMMYVSETYSGEDYDPKYFIDSPSEETINPSSYGMSRNLYHTQGSSINTENPFSTSESELMDGQSLDCVEYTEDKMRLKLQELERALLDDGADEEEDNMYVDGQWVDQLQINSHDSPKESSSSDSNLSSISTNREVSQPPSRTPKQLLLDCATAISEGNIREASIIIDRVRQIVSIQGDPPQRIAAYMVEGLAARMGASGKFLYKALKCKEPPSSDRLAAMQILFEVCPCFRFGFMAANGAIIEAFRGEKRVHIVDFDISQGSQYITLLQTLASLPGQRPYLRLTGVDDPESVQRPIGGLKNIGQRLEKLAEALNIPFEFRAVASRTPLVTPGMLDLQPREALVVNFAFQLHHMPDESVSMINERDQLLRMVKSLNPKLVTVVEQNVNTNTAPFLVRFGEAYSYYSAVFDSLDATLPRESQDRVNVERQCLARDIINVVACEGEERIERYEVAGKWRARMMMAGFASCPMSKSVTESIINLIRQYSERYKIKDDMGALHFGWEEKSLIVASAWR
ncbi:scarecrow-like protein 1 [Eucalyptus grandis]|uniref:scarecrow-like protein 1 n=1 Tax=Eucalyptus grandis TaxID=71139 RepID=UPI0001A687EB|nr:scarecrow-like protein 1 [Eucalyptus grandis]XP_010063896.2 scarecrow-like protein 1 [Eucalyptus grandis]XP_039157750.1 scarecrow-like protein 1 [Eucalyptus grandis]XP_039157751.1 scarecrow-like protein 1 [Eucalyptus grandis]